MKDKVYIPASVVKFLRLQKKEKAPVKMSADTFDFGEAKDKSVQVVSCLQAELDEVFGIKSPAVRTIVDPHLKQKIYRYRPPEKMCIRADVIHRKDNTTNDDLYTVRVYFPTWRPFFSDREYKATDLRSVAEVQAKLREFLIRSHYIFEHNDFTVSRNGNLNRGIAVNN